MAFYTYTARDESGGVSRGSLYANDRQAAAAALLEKKLVPILIKEDTSGGAGNAGGIPLLGFLNRGEKVKLQEKVVFSRQLATMINAGVPIVQSLNILQEQTSSKNLKRVLVDISKKVQGGTTLSKAMEEHPQVFSPIYINMVRAGETGGILDEVLERLAVQQEKDADIVQKVRGAMIYPAVITFVTLAAFFFMMTVIVPKLAAVFDSLGAQLPAYTKFLLATSKFLTHYGLFLIVGLVVGGILFQRWTKTAAGKLIFHTVLLKVPIFGTIITKVNIARFARTFGSLMSSGITVLDALNTTSQTLGNAVYKNAVAKLAVEVKNGKSINEPMRKSKIFPPIVAQMAMVGEETGQLDTILIKVAEFYEREVENVVANLTSIIEPVLIIAIGGMIGSIVIGILGPLGSLTNSV